MNKGIAFFLMLAMCFAAADLSAEEFKKKKRRKKKKKKELAFMQGQIGGQVAAGFLMRPNYNKADYSIYGTNTIDVGFPFSVRAEFGVAPVFGIGAGFGMYKDKVTINDVTVPENVYGYEHKYTMLFLRPAFHAPLNKSKLDVYAALPVGFTAIKATPFGNNNFVQQPLKSGLAWAFMAGTNFYFTKNIGVFFEGGYGQNLPLLNAGLSVKF
jgi:opacity protein-like surface antigen